MSRWGKTWQQLKNPNELRRSDYESRPTDWNLKSKTKIKQQPIIKPQSNNKNKIKAAVKKMHHVMVIQMIKNYIINSSRKMTHMTKTLKEISPKRTKRTKYVTARLIHSWNVSYLNHFVREVLITIRSHNNQRQLRKQKEEDQLLILKP